MCHIVFSRKKTVQIQCFPGVFTQKMQYKNSDFRVFLGKKNNILWSVPFSRVNRVTGKKNNIFLGLRPKQNVCLCPVIRPSLKIGPDPTSFIFSMYLKTPGKHCMHTVLCLFPLKHDVFIKFTIFKKIA